MTTTSLAQIAAEMRSYAIDNPRLATNANIDPYRRKLTGGLGLVLYIDPYHTWHLSLYRPNVDPSPKEAEIIRRTFNVPDHATKTRRQVDGWYIINLQWKEPSQQKLFNLEPKDTYYQK